jgi:hypothetical protein
VSVQVWVRLGGYITISEEDLALLKKEDPSIKPDAIVLEALKRNGFIACGDSYAPSDEDTEGDDQWDFDMSSLQLIFKEEGCVVEGGCPCM